MENVFVSLDRAMQMGGCSRPQVRRVDAPELATNGENAVVYVTQCSSADFDEHEQAYVAIQKQADPARIKGYRAKLVAKCWCDEEGNKLPATTDVIAKVSSFPPTLINRVYEAAWDVCTDMEWAKKNSNSQDEHSPSV